MFKPTTIRARLLACFVLLAVLPVIAVTAGSLTVAYDTGRRQVADRLASVAALKQSAIESWIHSIEEDLVVASNTDCAFERIAVVLTLSNDYKHYGFYNRAVRKRLQGLVGQSPQLDALFLIDLQGQVTLSTDEDEEGTDLSEQPFFHGGLLAPTVHIPFQCSEASASAYQQPYSQSVVVAIPVLGQQGRPLGVIAARADVQPLRDILGERTGLGSTGKACLLDAHHTVLAGTSPLSAASAGSIAFPDSVDAPLVNQALDGQTTASGLYRDHRGVLVLGTCRSIPQWGAVTSAGLSAGLLVEQDLSEGLHAVRGIILVNLAIGVGAVVLAVVAALFVTRTIADPLAGLAETATDIAGGDLDSRARTARDDEIGTLARAFNSMTAQLQDSITNLEERVAERTRALQQANQALEQRALQMETSARVSRELTSILDIDDLLTQVVELIRDAFQYYHVHIFLLDTSNDQLILRASTSSTMPEHRHIGVASHSINGQAMQSGEPVVVNDVRDSPFFLADRYLPDVQSEVVIPLRLGDQVIGTLDVQSAEPGAFTQQDLLVIQSLGDQIAVAIENARLYDRSQELAVLEERTRLARELHDSVTQSLYSVVLLTEGWRRSIRAGGAAHVEDYLTRIGQVNQQALKEMRLLIHELRPPALEEEGLLGALHQRLEAVEKRAGVDVRLIADSIVQLPHPVEEGLYRIAQEALNNALKHAAASHIVVRLAVADGRSVLEVEDDGRGFIVGAADGRGGMGLANMRDRAQALGGSLAVLSTPGQGTVVRATVVTERSG
ncbi:MAG: GAF domain-containing protein [Anaerolineae bacterium]